MPALETKPNHHPSDAHFSVLAVYSQDYLFYKNVQEQHSGINHKVFLLYPFICPSTHILNI